MKNLLRVAILSLIIFYSCVSVRFPETIKVDITIPSDFDIDKMQILIDTLKGLNKKMKEGFVLDLFFSLGFDWYENISNSINLFKR